MAQYLSSCSFSRYIDDVFIVSNNMSEIDALNISFLNLKLNTDIGKKVHFLDVEITIDNSTGTLDFSLFIKPTNTFSYLLTSSNHPNYIFKNIPKSLYIRIRRNNSSLHNYFYFSRLLTFQLMNRGYDFKKLRKISNCISKADRSSLLEYKTKQNNFVQLDKNTFLFKHTYDCNIQPYRKIINQAYKKTINANESLKNTKLKIITKIQPNIASILIHEFKPLFSKYHYCFPCNLSGCSTCKYIVQDYRIKINENFYIPISENSNCNAKCCIYLILCKHCQKIYIGETKNVTTRMYNHIYDIKKFVPFHSKRKCVPFHFSLKGHVYERDFCFYIINANITDLEDRLAHESAYINLINSIDKSRLINDFIPKPFYKKKTF